MPYVGAPRGISPWFESSAGGAFSHAMATIVIAAKNAPYRQRITADIQCDGVADEVEVRGAIADAIAAGGGHIQLTEGDFEFDSSMSTALSPANIMISGRGPNTVIKGSPLGATNELILFKFNSIAGLVIRDLSIDANGNYTLGGIQFQGGSRIWIHNTEYTDSAPIGSPASDRYGWVFNTATNTDVWFTENRTDGPQPQFSTMAQAVISNNIFKNSIKTAVVAINVVSASATIKDVLFEGNHVIVDSSSVLGANDVVGVEVATSPNNLSATTVERVVIKNNLIRYTTNGGAAILVGTTNTATAGGATKPIFRDIEISENQIIYEGSEDAGSSAAAILINNGATSAFDLDRIVIKDNYITGNATSSMAGISTGLMDHCEISNNMVDDVVHGYKISSMAKSRIIGNSALNCLTSGFTYDSTRQGNIFRDNDAYGTTPTVTNAYVFTNSHTSDKIIPFIPTAPSADLEDTTNQYQFVNSTTSAVTGATLATTGNITHGNIAASADNAEVILQQISQIGITDNAVTEVFTITNAAGDTGSYTAYIYSQVTNGHGASNTVACSQSQIHMLTRAKEVSVGVFDLSTVHAGSAVNTSSLNAAIASVAVTATETSENIMSVKFQVSITGSDGTFGNTTANIRVHCWVHLLHYDWATTPVIAT